MEQIVQLTDKYLAIPVKEGLYDYNNLPDFILREIFKLPIGSYTFLFLSSQAMEEDCKKVVDSWESVSGDGTIIYENYMTGIPKNRFAKKSFYSLLQSKGITGNAAILIKNN